MTKITTFKEFVIQKEAATLAEERPLANDKSSMKHLETRVYSLINQYRDSLVRASLEAGEKDDDIHHDIIRKSEAHKSILASIAELFSRVYDLEKGSSKLKPSFFSDTAFERIARYAKRKLGYHADDIGEHLKKINLASIDSLYHIWTPGSWIGA